MALVQCQFFYSWGRTEKGSSKYKDLQICCLCCNYLVHWAAPERVAEVTWCYWCWQKLNTCWSRKLCHCFDKFNEIIMAFLFRRKAKALLRAFGFLKTIVLFSISVELKWPKLYLTIAKTRNYMIWNVRVINDNTAWGMYLESLLSSPWPVSLLM